MNGCNTYGMLNTEITAGPIYHSDVEIDPELARKLRPRLELLSREERKRLPRHTVRYVPYVR